MALTCIDSVLLSPIPSGLRDSGFQLAPTDLPRRHCATIRLGNDPNSFAVCLQSHTFSMNTARSLVTTAHCSRLYRMHDGRAATTKAQYQRDAQREALLKDDLAWLQAQMRDLQHRLASAATVQAVEGCAIAKGDSQNSWPMW